jgi:endonuclease/exonuclease/phosphatase family metal-dependent hydrolase
MSRIRLLTANLWNGRAELQALASVIAEHDPDVVLTQEMTPEQARVIERALPHGLLLPSRDCRGMGLALRWPAQVRRIALPQRDALVAHLVPEGESTVLGPIEIINVHMSAPTRVGRLLLRRHQLRTLREHLARTPLRRVLAGDLNSLPSMPAYRVLRRHLRDAALERSRRPAATWSPRASWPRLLRIDHVLLAGLQVVDIEVVRIAGSDHSALLATLSWSEPHLRK